MQTNSDQLTVFAMNSRVARWTDAFVLVDSVQAKSVILAGEAGTFIDICRERISF